MATPKILLFYAFVPLADPTAIKMWQLTLADSLGLRGRILISEHGINGTVGGDVIQLKKYMKNTRAYLPFKGIDFKWSNGNADAEGRSADFPRLVVKVRKEIVTFGVPGELKVDEHGVIGGGTKLSPQQLNDLAAEKDIVFFDGRNKVEAEVGRFKGAIVPNVDTTREFIAEIESGKYDHLKDQPVVTYCTGGIRCEVLTPLMRSRGFQEVYQLDGGIVKYGEAFRDEGLWEGSLYVFDNRKTVTFSDKAAVIGHCYRCDGRTSRIEDCLEDSCLEQLVVCDSCAGASPAACPVHS
ncbi:MAG: rhodanese-related sulfurtransferase [Aeromicrobium sp.]